MRRRGFWTGFSGASELPPVRCRFCAVPARSSVQDRPCPCPVPPYSPGPGWRDFCVPGGCATNRDGLRPHRGAGGGSHRRRTRRGCGAYRGADERRRADERGAGQCPVPGRTEDRAVAVSRLDLRRRPAAGLRRLDQPGVRSTRTGWSRSAALRSGHRPRRRRLRRLSGPGRPVGGSGPAAAGRDGFRAPLVGESPRRPRRGRPAAAGRGRGHPRGGTGCDARICVRTIPASRGWPRCAYVADTADRC